jgi:two-component system CheB/CheR fusion protein
VSTSKKLPPKKPKTKSSVLKIGSSSLQTDDPKQLFANFPIVGIGASAGGLEAFTKLLANLPIDTGMGFVLIQHLDPKHESLSSDILSRVTKMPVIEVKNGMRVERNHIYVIPAGFRMGILHGVLNLIPRVEDRSQHFVIDFFLKTLALDQRDRAVGVVLSGTGTDGTQGLMAIKAEGGITFSQLPETAKFDSMPRSAIAAGNVDIVLSPEKISEELSRIAKYSHVSTALIEPGEATMESRSFKLQDSLSHIFLLLRNECHVDFTLYKANTINRRLERRMVLHKMENLKAYADFLSLNPSEVKALYADILINVTDFFRDPEAFEALKTEVFPKLMENRSSGKPIRVWVPACSTGEEAYSIAIALLEFLGDKAAQTPIQIFASDISEQAIQKARVAEYVSISDTVSTERLNRFFVRLENGAYKITKAVRDICLFSRQDITIDPPFGRIDLISCRNLLIYFTPVLQKHVIPIFHYSLSPRGFLWLGKSETIGGSSDLFMLVDKANKIYLRTNAPIALNLRFPASSYVQGKPESVQAAKNFKDYKLDTLKVIDQALTNEFSGVLVDEQMEILEFRGKLAPFIEVASGAPTHNLLKMVQPDLSQNLRVAIQAAQTSGQSVKKTDLSIGKGKYLQMFDLRVVPIKISSKSKARLYLILFEKTQKSDSKKEKRSSKPGKISNIDIKKHPYVLELQKELAALQEYQQSLVERSDSAQEDLTTANEELQTANEELQSTNEELETAKEELQSGNEELTTVNDELQTRSVEQIDTNNDLINLLGSVEIPIVMLGDDRKVRRFTPLAGKALNLIPTDVGRPLSDLKLNFVQPGGVLDLETMVSATIETLASQEVEVQDRKGHWFRLQVRPYKTIDNKIDGAVLALVDIDTLKLTVREVKKARSEAEKANRAKDLFLATLSHELRTPLTAILSWGEMIHSGKLDAVKTKRGAEIIVECGKTQAQLINDLLDVSRIVAGKLSLDTREIDPTSAVLGAIEAVRSTAEAKSIDIETYFAPQIGTVMADPVRLRQVFWNLLSNAVKFSSPQSKVIIRVERVNDLDGEKAKAMIQISDSGKGIELDFLPKIFDRFTQEDGSSIRIHGGLGLGLAIVRNLVELHGGTIDAKSGGNQLGATFTVLLPIKSNQALLGFQAPQADPLKSSITIGNAAIRLDGIRVLLVDDEANAREAFSELLNSFGAEVRAVGSSREGLNLLMQFRPQVVVSDIAMPGEDGYNFIKKIRALSPSEGGITPALAMTAYAGEEDIRRALSSGFQAHLSKPVDGQELAKTIAKLVSRNLTLK